MSNVREVTTDAEFLKAFPIMVQLRTHLTPESYLDLLKPMKEEGYQLFAAYNAQDEIAGLAGVAIKTNFFHKRHVYVFDLITDESQRSSGYGKQLLDYVDVWAKENGCEFVALDSGLQRLDAHRFYETKAGLTKWCYSFHKTL
jgi:GNAT superfamily N-acetyltransferase